MKLQQGQIWKQGQVFFRIVRLERLAVEYKEMTDLANRKGAQHKVTKKEFCRMLKGAALLATEIQSRVRLESVPAPKTDPTGLLKLGLQ